MQINFKSYSEVCTSKKKVFLLFDDLQLSQKLEEIDAASSGSIKALLEGNNGFKAKLGSALSGAIIHAGCTLVLIGCGSREKISRKSLNTIGATIAVKLNKMKIDSAEVVIDGNIASEDIDLQTVASYIAEGIKMRNYTFDKYFVNKKEGNTLALNSIDIAVDDHTKASEVFKSYSAIVDGVNLTRDLTSEPPNVLYPETFASRCMELSDIGLKVKVLEQSQLEKLGMGALLGVSQGSAKAPKVVVMEWWGDKDGKGVKPLAVIGKGVTFDTGGLNLKSSAGMATMKYDMGGAGVVTGLMKSLALNKVEKNVIGFLGLVENMPSGTAQRPSDVVTTMSGQTVEIENTDAEGRLVLADVMWYAQTKYECKTIIDLATLTGAITAALGDEFAGLFSNSEQLADDLIRSGKEVNELLWRMPLSEHYDKKINSDIADMTNAPKGAGAGSTTAAQFLQRFLKEKSNKWAHLDIAGVAWTANGELTNGLKGATGFGVRLLEEFIQKHYKPSA